MKKFGFALAMPLIVLLLAVLPVPDFWISQFITIGLYALPCMGLVLLTGVMGLTSFGQAAFVGIGAYASAWLTLNTGLSPWMGLLLGLSITTVSAVILAFITLRMSGHYLPLATIAWGLALYFLMGNLETLGKYDGLLAVPGLQLFSWNVGAGRGFFVFTWAIVLLSALALTRLLNSRTGRAMRAIKNGTQMAEAMGISSFRYKLIAFVIAAELASVSGWLLAHYQHSVNPSAFGLKMGIEYLFMTVVGGVGYIGGAIVGAGITKVLDDQLQVLLPKLIGTSGSYEVIVFGVVLVVMLKFLPDGLWQLVERFLPRSKRVFPTEGSAQSASLPEKSKHRTDDLILEVSSIRKEFGGLVAVNDISFDIKAGQIVGLIGPNGAGKSTTFNLITNVLPTTSGTVRFRGQEIQHLLARDIAGRGISRTFQHVKMIADMTVLENVALGAHIRGHKGSMSAMLGLDKEEEAMLFQEARRQLERVGMGSMLHELAGNLPMGPQRLLEIARALCLDPALLLLDEPAAGLRHKEKQALVSVLRQLQSEGLSILLVEHDMDMVMDVCDHLVVMEFGTLLMQGNPSEVQQSPAVRAAYLGVEH